MGELRLRTISEGSPREVKDTVMNALEYLDDTSKAVLVSAFGLDAQPKMDSSEIASMLMLTEAHVESIQLKAFRQLRTGRKLN